MTVGFYTGTAPQEILDFLDDYLISAGNGAAIDAMLAVFASWELDSPQVTAIGSTGFTFTSPLGETLEIAGSGFGPITSITDLEQAFNDWASAMLTLDNSGTATLNSVTLRDAASNILAQLTLTASALTFTVGDLEVKFLGAFPTNATALTNIILEFYTPGGGENPGDGQDFMLDGTLAAPEDYNQAAALAAAYGIAGLEIREAGVLLGEVGFTPAGAVFEVDEYTATLAGSFPLTLADWIEALLRTEAGQAAGIEFDSLTVVDGLGETVFEASYPGVDLSQFTVIEGTAAGDNLYLDGEEGPVLAVGLEGNDTIWDDRWSTGNAYDDILDGGAGNDLIISQDGDDLILPGTNDNYDSIVSVLGNKTIDFDAASEAPAGYYHVEYTTAADAIASEIGAFSAVALFFDINETLGYVYKGWTGGTSAEYVDEILNAGQINGDIGGLGFTAGAGDDTAYLNISAAGSWVSFEGRAGDDTIIGSANWEVLRHSSSPGAGITVTVVSGGADGNSGTLVDEYGDTDTFADIEEIRGTYSDDVYIGSSGDDRFIPYGGNNYFDGGAGFDRVRYDQSDVSFAFVDMRAETATVGRGADPAGLTYSTDTLISIEDVRLGRSGEQTFIGADVDERVRGRGEWNFYDMGGGDDLAQAYSYAYHEVRGGAGDDEVRIYGDLADFTVTIGAGMVSFDRGDGYVVDVFRDVETVTFNDGSYDIDADFADPTAGIIGEVGTVTLDQADSATWHYVAFSAEIQDAVVVMGPPSYAGSQPLTMRVRDVTDAGFWFQYDEWDYIDGGHIAETVSWIAIAAGEHNLADGRTIVAGQTSSNHDFANGAVSFDDAFDAAPIVLTQASSINGAAAVTTRVTDITADGFATAVQEEQAADGYHAYEDIGWIAVEAGANVDEGISAGLASAIGSAGGALNYGGTFSEAPALFASIQSYKGPDPAALRYTANGTSSASVFTEEERSADQEVYHANEAVGFLALETGLLAGASRGLQAGTEIVSQANSSEWHSVTFDAPIADAVVVMGPPSYNGSQPLVVRVRNVTDTGFEFQLDEWDYLDGGHSAESVGWLAISAGETVMEDGSVIVAGSSMANHNFSEVDLGDSFGTDTPMIFAQVASTNGAAATVARMQAVDSDSFELRVQEEQAADGFHSYEEVNWIAVVESGGDEVTGTAVVGSAGAEIDFSETMSYNPVILASMQSYAGGDPASLRLTSSDASGFGIFVEEEKSADAEVYHANETIAWAALDSGYYAL